MIVEAKMLIILGTLHERTICRKAIEGSHFEDFGNLRLERQMVRSWSVPRMINILALTIKVNLSFGKNLQHWWKLEIGIYP
jgi:hypothetical protein